LFLNILANYAGRGVSAVATLVMVPLYLRTLGVEAYGIVSLLAIAQSFVGLLDFGLGITLNREMARSGPGERPDLLRTFEIVYWGAAAVLFGLSFFAAPLVTRLVNVKATSPEEVRDAIVLIGITVALQFPCSAYGAALAGIERQVALNAITGLCVAVRAVASVLVLSFVSRTPAALIACYLLAALGQAIASGWASWHYAAPFELARPKFHGEVFAGVWRFSMQAFALTIAGICMSQSDKASVAGLTAMSDFGAYSLSAQFAAIFTVICGPIGLAAFPRLAGHARTGATDKLGQTYGQVLRFAAFVTFPPALLACAFPGELILFWTHNPTVARGAVSILPLLVAATALNGFFGIGINLSLAAGYVRLPMILNFAMAIVAVLLAPWAVKRMGATGAALSCLAVNLTWGCIFVPLLHRRLLPESWTKYYRGSLVPLLVAAIPVVIARLASPALTRAGVNVILLIVTAYAGSIGAIACAHGGLRRSYAILRHAAASS
jgi:O-antigen/teichoic acid export membrane protein